MAEAALQMAEAGTEPPYRVIVWGTGVVGKMVIGELFDNPQYELVGVIVHNPDKAGVDVGELIGRGPIGLAASDDADAVLATAADVVAYYGPTAEQAGANRDNHIKALRAGKHVVSTAMSPWVYHKSPKVSPSEWAAVQQACVENARSCFTTGIDPGFMNDILPLLLTGVCGRVDSLRIQEIIDYSSYAGSAYGPMALAAPLETKGLLEEPELLIYAWGPTIYLMADQLRAPLERVDTVYEKWATPEDIVAADGSCAVQAGHCAAVRFEIRGWVGGRAALVIEHVNRITNQAAPHWPRAKLAEDDCYRILIEGSPNIEQETLFRGSKGEAPAVAGCLATGMRAIHAIPAVCAAVPGVISADELPLGPGIGVLGG